MVLRWLICPVLFLAANLGLFLRPEAARAVVPAPWRIEFDGAVAGLHLKSVTLSQAFYIGQELQKMEGGSKKNEATVLERAASILGVETVTTEDMRGMEQRILELDTKRGPWAYAMGMLNFVNVMWFMSIMGILTTFMPVVAVLLQPFATLLRRLWTQVIYRLWTQVIYPALLRIHRWGVLETLAYAAAFVFLVHGGRYPAHFDDAGTFVSLTGGLAAIALWFYSTALHVTGGEPSESFVSLSNAFAALTLAPLAVTHQSRLMGTLTGFAFYGALGFSAFNVGLCFFIGFTSRDALIRVAVTSFLLICTLVTLHLCGVQGSYYVQPFGPALMCLGNVTYFLAMLISSSQHVCKNEKYVVLNACMVASLVAALATGHILGLAGMVNTTTVFLVLYAMTKINEMGIFRSPRWGVLYVFTCCVGMYNVSHWLHTHPEFLIDIFTFA